MPPTKATSSRGTSGSDDERQSLQLEEDECVTVSPDSPRFAASYRTVRPQSIDEVREILGLTNPPDAWSQSSARCCQPPDLSSRLVRPEELDHPDPSVKAEARRLTYVAAQAYVQSPNENDYALWKPVIDKWLLTNKALINILELWDIDVANGATLTISPNTHALYARHIRIHGTGRIVCKSHVTIRATDLEGTHFPLVFTSVEANAVKQLLSKEGE